MIGGGTVDNLCTSGGLHSGSMEKEDHSVPSVWTAGAFEMVGACGVADVPAVASVGR